MNAANPPGVRVLPMRFTPTDSKFKGQECRGLSFVITDWKEFKSFEFGLTIAHSLRLPSSAPFVRFLNTRVSYENAQGERRDRVTARRRVGRLHDDGGVAPELFEGVRSRNSGWKMLDQDVAVIEDDPAARGKPVAALERMTFGREPDGVIASAIALRWGSELPVQRTK